MIGEPFLVFSFISPSFPPPLRFLVMVTSLGFLCFFFFCNVSPPWGPLLLPFSHTLGSVFIIQESCRLWEIKFQSKSFSSLKFEFD
jgi:hypothetical protein